MSRWLCLVTHPLCGTLLAAHHQEGLPEAFARLRNYARSHSERLTTVAREVVGGTLHLN